MISFPGHELVGARLVGQLPTSDMVHVWQSVSSRVVKYGFAIEYRDLEPPRTGIFDGLQLDLVNWWRFVAAEVDALLAGEELAIWRVVNSLWPTLRKPRFWCDGQHQRTALPTYGEGTLIMRNVHDLTLADQEAMLDWCEHHQTRSRMIATAPRHLPALVESGRFNRRLYDHLRSVQLQLP